MKPQEILEEMRMFINMDEDQFTQKLFFDDTFMARFNEAERLYGKLLLKYGKRTGSLQMTPICKENSKHVVFVTPSARKKGEWQRTIFLNSTPLSHKEYKTLKELVEENQADWFLHGLWMKEEDSSL